MNFGGDKEYLHKIESTAMADIVFILLIFFLLSSNFMVQTGIDLELPKTVDASPMENREVVVTIGADGELIVGETPVTMEEVEATLAAALEEAADNLVVIRADARSEFGLAVEVMDIGRRLGAQLAVATEPRDAESQQR